MDFCNDSCLNIKVKPKTACLICSFAFRLGNVSRPEVFAKRSSPQKPTRGQCEVIFTSNRKAVDIKKVGVFFVLGLQDFKGSHLAEFVTSSK